MWSSPWPWHIPAGDRVVAVNQLGTTTVDRLLELVERCSGDISSRVRRAVREVTS